MENRISASEGLTARRFVRLTAIFLFDGSGEENLQEV